MYFWKACFYFLVSHRNQIDTVSFSRFSLSCLCHCLSVPLFLLLSLSLFYFPISLSLSPHFIPEYFLILPPLVPPHPLKRLVCPHSSSSIRFFASVHCPMQTYWITADCQLIKLLYNCLVMNIYDIHSILRESNDVGRILKDRTSTI